MKHIHPALVATIVMITAFSGLAAEWESLTPNNSLDGWRVLSGEWNVNEEGVLTGKAEKNVNGWIIYEKRPFSDFEMTLEFKTPTPTNGGVQLRSHWLPRMPLQEGETVADTPKQMYGYQVNVETRSRKGTGIIMEENGRGYLANPGVDALKTLKQHDWNAMRICARGDVIEVYLRDAVERRASAQFIARLVSLSLIHI